MALKEKGVYEDNLFQESQGWQSVTPRASDHNLDIQKNLPRRGTINGQGWTVPIQVASGPAKLAAL